jgi:hypothetical protein
MSGRGPATRGDPTQPWLFRRLPSEAISMPDTVSIDTCRSDFGDHTLAVQASPADRPRVRERRREDGDSDRGPDGR